MYAPLNPHRSYAPTKGDGPLLGLHNVQKCGKHQWFGLRGPLENRGGPRDGSRRCRDGPKFSQDGPG
eukprot:6249111-Pyramimonas_sp.AAC.1